MTEQMTPAEMRERATALRKLIEHEPWAAEGSAAWVIQQDILAGADALDRLARVQEVYELWFASTVNGCADETEMLLVDVSDALHGDTTNHENRSE